MLDLPTRTGVEPRRGPCRSRRRQPHILTNRLLPTCGNWLQTEPGVTERNVQRLGLASWATSLLTILARRNAKLLAKGPAKMGHIVETPIISNFTDGASGSRRQRKLCTTALESAAPYSPHQRLFFIREQLVNISRRQVYGCCDARGGEITIAQVVSYMAQYPL